jgi:hypothetical protein
MTARQALHTLPAPSATSHVLGNAPFQMRGIHKDVDNDSNRNRNKKHLRVTRQDFYHNHNSAASDSALGRSFIYSKAHLFEYSSSRRQWLTTIAAAASNPTALPSNPGQDRDDNHHRNTDSSKNKKSFLYSSSFSSSSTSAGSSIYDGTNDTTNHSNTPSAWLAKLEEEVSSIEYYPPGFLSTHQPHIQMDRIYNLMKQAVQQMQGPGKRNRRSTNRRQAAATADEEHHHNNADADTDEDLFHQFYAPKHKYSSYYYENGEAYTFSGSLSSVQRERTAQLVERLLHKVLSESLLTSQYAGGVVAQQFKVQEEEDGEQDEKEQEGGETNMRKDATTLTNQSPISSDEASLLETEKDNHDEFGADDEGAYEETTNFETGFNYHPVYPTLMMYTMAIQGWSNSISIQQKPAAAHASHSNRQSNSRNRNQNNKEDSASWRAKEVLALMQSQWNRHQEEREQAMKKAQAGGSGKKIKMLYESDELRGSYGVPPAPDVVCYTSALRAFIREGFVVEAQALLDEMIDTALQLQTTNVNVDQNSNVDAEDEDKNDTQIPVPDLFCFRIVLAAWLEEDSNIIVKQGNGDHKTMSTEERLGHAKALLQRMDTLRVDHPSIFGYLQPETRTYNTYLQGLVNLSSKKNPAPAWDAYEMWKKQLWTHANNGGDDGGANSDNKQQQHQDSSSLEADADANQSHVGEVVQTHDMQANTVTCNMVMNALAKTSSAEAALAAEDILQKMLQRHGAEHKYDNSAKKAALMMDDEEENRTAKPNQMSFHTVLKAWARAASDLHDEPWRPARRSSKGEHDQQKGSHTPPPSPLIQVRPDQHANKLLQLMERLHAQDPLRWHDLQPTTYTCNSVLNVMRHCASLYPMAAPRAHQLFEYLITTTKNNNRQRAYDDEDAYGSSQKQEQTNDGYASTSSNMMEPDQYTYQTVIQAWCKSVPRRQKGGQRQSRRDQSPRDREAHRSNCYNAPLKAEEVLLQMNHHYEREIEREREGESSILYNKDDYSSSSSSDIKPHLHTCTAILEAWARSTNPDAPIRTREFIDWMNKQQQLGVGQHSPFVLPPDVLCYMTAMQVWLSTLQRLTRDWVRLNQVSRNKRKPNEWEERYTPEQCLEQIQELLHELEHLSEQNPRDPSLRPSTACYNVLLNACAYCHPPYVPKEAIPDILSLAVRTCQSLRASSTTILAENEYRSSRRQATDNVGPDETTYYWMIKVLEHWNQFSVKQQGSSNDDDGMANQYFQEVFDGCCAEGLMSPHVWYAMQRSMSKEWIEAQGGGRFNVDGGRDDEATVEDEVNADLDHDSYAPLPFEWKRNVEPSKRNMRLTPHTKQSQAHVGSKKSEHRRR